MNKSALRLSEQNLKGGNPSFWARPATKMGRWAVVLGATFVVLYIINATIFMPLSSDAAWRHIVLPFYSLGMLLCGLASGIASLTAIIKWQERSWMVWLAIVPGLMMAFLLLGEFAVPH